MGQSYHKQQKSSNSSEDRAEFLRSHSLTEFYKRKRCSFCHFTVPAETPQYGGIFACTLHARKALTYSYALIAAAMKGAWQ